MSHFEFVSVAVSILISITIAQLLRGVFPAMGPGRSGLHVGWLLFQIFGAILTWWSLWLSRDADWNLAYFVVVLAGPMAAYLQAVLLVPANAETVPSWGEFFFGIRRRFFGLQLVIGVQAAMVVNLGRAEGAGADGNLLTLAGLVLSCLGFASSRIQVQYFVLVATWVTFGLGAFWLVFRPG